MNDLYDLLEESIFSVDGVGVASLPGVLAELGADRVEGFSALAPHQEAAWHSFLVQLAAFAVSRMGLRPADAEGWRVALLQLTDGETAPWRLVVEDPSQPAFLQPPAPEGKLSAYSKVVDTPDGLDVLVTAKNHDLKLSRLRYARPEHWAFALVSAQTSQGFSGRANYGVTRMNGGFSNRAQVAFVRSLRWGVRWRDELDLLLRIESDVIRGWGYNPAGEALSWRLPWDGTTSMHREDLHPWYIEASRRLRLVSDDGVRLVARKAPTKKPRLVIETGDVGDPWIPLDEDKKGRKALTVASSGFTLKTQLDLLYGIEGRFQRPAAMAEPTSDTQEVLLVGRALARGQGKTEGLHDLLVAVPTRKRRRRRRDGAEAPLATQRSRVFLEHQLTVQKALYGAVQTLLNGSSRARDPRVSRWTDAYRRATDTDLLPMLHNTLDGTDEEAEKAWIRSLRARAQHQLEDAIARAPVPASRRRRAVAEAESVFHGSIHKHYAEYLGGDHAH